MTLEDFLKKTLGRALMLQITLIGQSDSTKKILECGCYGYDHGVVSFKLKANINQKIDGLNGVSVSIERYENYSEFVLNLKK